MSQVGHFLDYKFQWQPFTDKDYKKQLQVHLSQLAFTKNLIQLAQLETSLNISDTPYRSGYPVDSLPESTTAPSTPQLVAYMRLLADSLNWLAQGTRPDLSTITAMLARYLNRPTKKHIDTARYAIKCVKHTSHLGIIFNSKITPLLKTFNQFLTDPLHALTDANWSSQDQSTSKTKSTTFPLFKSRSMSGHIIHLYDPLHWQCKRQMIMARSSAEAEIYATDECVRELTYLRKVINDLNLQHIFLKNPLPIHNDNMTSAQ